MAYCQVRDNKGHFRLLNLSVSPLVVAGKGKVRSCCFCVCGGSRCCWRQVLEPIFFQFLYMQVHTWQSCESLLFSGAGRRFTPLTTFIHSFQPRLVLCVQHMRIWLEIKAAKSEWVTDQKVLATESCEPNSVCMASANVGSLVERGKCKWVSGSMDWRQLFKTKFKCVWQLSYVEMLWKSQS